MYLVTFNGVLGLSIELETDCCDKLHLFEKKLNYSTTLIYLFIIFNNYFDLINFSDVQVFTEVSNVGVDEATGFIYN